MARPERSGTPTPGPGNRPAGTLFVVATPIGNLEDITLRALRVLREVQLVAAEDTRRTSHLLGHYGITSKLISVHEHNEQGRVPQLLARLAAGDSIALVTDAGTPGASDPGMILVGAAREAGYRVEGIPGPSAIMTALSVAGHPFEGFTFVGFPPIKAKDRNRWLEAVRSSERPVVLYEAPHRVRKTLSEMASILVDRPILMARELTKLHEEVVISNATGLLDRLKDPKGEFTFIVFCPARDSAATVPLSEAEFDERVAAELGRTTENSRGFGKRERLRVIAERLGASVREVYSAAERLKNRS